MKLHVKTSGGLKKRKNRKRKEKKNAPKTISDGLQNSYLDGYVYRSIGSGAWNRQIMSGGLAVGRILQYYRLTQRWEGRREGRGDGSRYLPSAFDSSSRVMGSSLGLSRATAWAGANFFVSASCADMVDLLSSFPFPFSLSFPFPFPFPFILFLFFPCLFFFFLFSLFFFFLLQRAEESVERNAGMVYRVRYVSE